MKIVENPYHTYDSDSKYAPLPNVQMWEYVVALNGVDCREFSYTDLVVLHSFLARDYTAYYYAENARQLQFQEEELAFVDDRSTIKRMDHKVIDYSEFPVICNSQYSPRIETRSIEYRKGVQIFSQLKDANKDSKKLYELIHLYEFARHFERTHKIYRNANFPLSLYFTILDSQIGSPENCGEVYCEVCKREVFHPVKSHAAHYRSFFGDLLKDVSKVRHSTYHNGAYFDFGEHLSAVMAEMRINGIPFTNDRKWKLYHDKKQVVEEIVRVLLTSRFLEVYSNGNAA